MTKQLCTISRANTGTCVPRWNLKHIPILSVHFMIHVFNVYTQVMPLLHNTTLQKNKVGIYGNKHKRLDTHRVNKAQCAIVKN